jgi:hypothetical protein
MNLALALIIFFMVYWNRTFEHHMITAIAMAAYTFTALTTAIISVVRYRRYNSPVYSASKAISLAAALVSMLTLESTMLTTFGKETMTEIERKWMLGLTGGAISLLIVATAIGAHALLSLVPLCQGEVAAYHIPSPRVLPSLPSEQPNVEQDNADQDSENHPVA